MNYAFDPKLQAFINWTRDTYAPEEIIWSTLIRMNGAPGGLPDDGSVVWGQASLLKWVDNTKSHGGNYPDCYKGKSVHGICLFGIGDLSWLLANKSKAFFAKKFSDEFDDLVLQCIEEELHLRELQYDKLERQSKEQSTEFLDGPPL